MEVINIKKSCMNISKNIQI